MSPKKHLFPITEIYVPLWIQSLHTYHLSFIFILSNIIHLIFYFSDAYISLCMVTFKFLAIFSILLLKKFLNRKLWLTCRKHVINSNFNNLGLYAYLTNVFPCISHEKSNSFSHHWEKMCQFIIVVVFQMCSFRSRCICRSDAGWANCGFFLPTSIVSGEKYLFCSQRFNS